MYTKSHRHYPSQPSWSSHRQSGSTIQPHEPMSSLPPNNYKRSHMSSENYVYNNHYNYSDDLPYSQDWVEPPFDMPSEYEGQPYPPNWQEECDTQQEFYEDYAAQYNVLRGEPSTPSYIQYKQQRHPSHFLNIPHYTYDFNHSYNYTYHDYYGSNESDNYYAYDRAEPDDDPYDNETPETPKKTDIDKQSHASTSAQTSLYNEYQNKQASLNGYDSSASHPTLGSGTNYVVYSDEEEREHTTTSKQAQNDVSASKSFSSTSRVHKCNEIIQRIEQDFLANKEEIYKEKLSALKAKLESIQNEDYKPLKDQVKKLGGIRRETIDKAKMSMEYQLMCIERQYDADTRTVEDELLTDRHDLRSAMVSLLDEKKKRLKTGDNSTERLSDKLIDELTDKYFDKTTELAEDLVFFARNRNKHRSKQEMLTVDKIFSKKSGMLRAVANRRHTVDRMKDRASLDTALTAKNVAVLDADIALIRKNIAKAKEISGKIVV
ncbi:Sds3-like-domain-containing protein [Spinellus fusiger]|nr:Sds3-like-domain-containing protein [Spinellus fusiger]